jgi:3-hydroxyacyl-[acyl-carrier-protein] dehydratase
VTAKLVALDRVLALEPGECARALRNVPNTLSLFDSHFPLRPVLPGVLVLGSMGELARVLLARSPGGAWRLAGAERVRYRHFVRPGDQMEIEVRMREQVGGEAVLSATVRVEEKVVTSARALRMVRTEPARQP